MNEVIIGIFLKYLLLPLIVVILGSALMYVRSRAGVVKKNKSLIIYTLVGALCIAVLGLLGFMGNMFNPYGYLFSMLVYLGLGITNINLLHRYFRSSDNKPSATLSILFETLVTLTVMSLGGYLFYLIFSWLSPYPGYAPMAATCICVFIVPLSFYYCYLQLLNIPPDIYATWQPALSEKAVEMESVVFKRLLLLNVELTKDVTGGDRFRIQAKAPDTGVSFGAWFYRVATDYNAKNPNAVIQMRDNAQNEAYYWIFYTKKSLFHRKKYIDFRESVAANGIAENSTIICKRVEERAEGAETETEKKETEEKAEKAATAGQSQEPNMP